MINIKEIENIDNGKKYKVLLDLPMNIGWIDYMNFTSTHDIFRTINIFSSNDFNVYSEWAWNLNNNDLEWCRNFKLTKEQYQKGKEMIIKRGRLFFCFLL